MTSELNKKEIAVERMGALSFYLAWIGVCTSVLTIIILFCDGHIYFSGKVDKEFFGIVGDFIGGVVGTIFSLVAVILVYMTYQSQKEELIATRRLLKEQTELMNQSYLNENFNNLFVMINNTSKDIVVFTKSSTFHYGIENIDHFDPTVENPVVNVYDNLNMIFYLFKTILTEVSLLPENEGIRNLKSKIYFFYYSKILFPFHEHLLKKYGEQMYLKHDDSKPMLELYCSITKDALNYLSENGAITNSNYKKNIIKEIEDFQSFMVENENKREKL